MCVEGKSLPITERSVVSRMTLGPVLVVWLAIQVYLP